jgi:hypothetical protein
MSAAPVTAKIAREIQDEIRQALDRNSAALLTIATEIRKANNQSRGKVVGEDEVREKVLELFNGFQKP